MPRKRRKSSFQSKPSLVFTESPVNIVKNVPSPVMCARYPQTATSVPIDELQELAWESGSKLSASDLLQMVSPQFARIPSTGGVFGRRRPTRHRQSISANVINKENTYHHPVTHGFNNKKTKFRTLTFLGEKTVEESTAEEVNISYETVSNSDIDSGNDARISEQESPVDPTMVQNIRGSKRKMEKMRFSKRLSDIHFPNTDDHSTPVIQSKKINSEDNLSSDESSTLDLTKLKTKIMKSPVKRLFASQIKSHDTDDDTDILDQNDMVSTIPTGCDSNKCDSDVDLVKETDVSSNCFTDHEPESASETVSVRRSLRIKLLQQLFEDKVSPYKDAKHTTEVIVPDTPEDKYGWPLKKKQIKEYISNKR